MQKEERDLRERTKEFALRTIRMFSTLAKTTEAQILGKQVLRPGTAPFALSFGTPGLAFDCITAAFQLFRISAFQYFAVIDAPRPLFLKEQFHRQPRL